MAKELVERIRAWRPGSNFWAGVFFAALTLVVLRNVVLHGEVFASTNSLYNGPPFNSVAPPGWRSGGNGLLADSPYFFQPLWDITRERLRAGSLPLWNPLIGSGTPLLADQQSGVFSVVNFPIWVLPFEAGLAVSAGLKLWLAGFGTYLLGRRLELSALPAVAAGTGFALGAYSVMWLSHGHLNVMALLPWALFTAHRLAQRPTLGRGLAHGAVLGLALLGGHPESEIFLVLAVWLFFGVQLAVDRRRGPELRGRLLVMTAASAFALLLAAVTIIPFLAELSGSIDRLVRGGDRVGPREGLLTLFFPDWWGRPVEGSTLGPLNYNERTFYAGAVLLVFVPFALVRSRFRRVFAPVVVLGVFGLLASTDATATSKLLGKLPLLDQTTRGRLSVYLILAVALLGGAGLEAIRRSEVSRRTLRVVVGAALAVGLVALIAIQPVGSHAWWDGAREVVGLSGFSTYHPLVSLADPSTRDAFETLRVAAILRWIVLVGAAGLALFAARRGLLSARWLVPALVVLVVIDMATFANGYQPTVPTGQFYRPVPRSVQILQQRVGSGRMAAAGTALGADVPLRFRLRDARALDHPTPLRVYNFWRASLNHAQGALDGLSIPEVTPRAGHDLSVMGVTYLLVAPGDPPPPRPQFRRIYSGPDASVWQNRDAVPRAYSVSGVQAAASAEDALRQTASPTFDPRKAAVIEGPRSLDRRERRANLQPATFVRDNPEHVSMVADLDRPGVVVVADRYASGWKVKVDGRDAEPLRANYLYRGVAAPAGRHRIEWTYRPTSVVLGMIVSGLTALVGLVAAAFLWRRRRSG